MTLFRLFVALLVVLSMATLITDHDVRLDEIERILEKEE